ncbi:phage exclusion protein Lit family protein [Pseudomonas aeruginosa]|uniref:phage exclusion protein Lit family protein n=1 Tax=Pseudomonas aeruginosa TaxID=287 RepID=UPI001C94F718|nr:phage exclusion protein Lit family protein [Pseudomonas aeruginosa]MBY5286872.1 peptidase U49, Lit peptidase [Pseudomonas aeruginosa]MEA8564121.1 phage exclusion protein Lit family protein [Pseudomonas aeruginosa]MEA8576340.1 phage exclusion protein Lit family protein [Pseudomonas aeruginosa]MEA8609399.1 phage exclusion protein Lit family protein [Pseudomonas aeruginosa]
MNHQLNHPQAEQAVLRLLKAAVPERSSEIDDLWKKYKPAVQISEDSPGTSIDATRHRIRFDNKTMRAIWLIGFNGWNCLSLYSPAVVLAQIFNLSIDQILGEDDERGRLEFDYRSRSSLAERLVSASSPDAITWPEDIPEPGSDRENLTSDQEKVTFDLVCMATAYVFLHEFRHVMFDSDGDRPSARLEEETSCDVWARAFMTEKIGEYARATTQPHQSFLQKRAMAMALGAIILHDLTPETGRWGSEDYPPIADRIHSMVSGIGPSLDSNYWLFAACLLIGVFRRSGRSLPMTISDNRKLVDDLIEQLR